MTPMLKINKALDKAVKFINAGDSPTVALEKTAKAHNLNPNFIQRTGEALNAALHMEHIKTAKDRSANFPIADIKEATRRIYTPAKQKTAEHFPPVREQIDYNKYLNNDLYKKAHVSIVNSQEQKNDSLLSTKFRQVQNHLKKLATDLEDLKSKEASNNLNTDMAFLSLTKTFKKEASARSPFSTFETQVFAEHGERAVPYLDLIYKEAKLKEQRGDRKDTIVIGDKCKEAQAFDYFMKCADNICSYKQKVKEASDEYFEFNNSYKEASAKLRPEYYEMQKKAAQEFVEDVDVIIKEAVSSLDIVKNIFDKYKETKPSKTLFENRQIDNRERAILLQELAMTDPILKDVEPARIAEAYQQMVRLAPLASKEKELARAKLREMTASQAVHPVDANQLVETDINILKQKQLRNAPISFQK